MTKIKEDFDFKSATLAGLQSKVKSLQDRLAEMSARRRSAQQHGKDGVFYTFADHEVFEDWESTELSELMADISTIGKVLESWNMRMVARDIDQREMYAAQQQWEAFEVSSDKQITLTGILKSKQEAARLKKKEGVWLPMGQMEYTTQQYLNLTVAQRQHCWSIYETNIKLTWINRAYLLIIQSLEKRLGIYG